MLRTIQTSWLCVCDWSCELKCVVGYRTAVWGTLCTLSFSSENTLSPVICFDTFVGSAFLQTNRWILSFPKCSVLDIQLIWKELYWCRKCATTHSLTCHHCLVIHVLTNVGMFGVDRKYIMSSLDQRLSNDVNLNCVFNKDKWNE